MIRDSPPELGFDEEEVVMPPGVRGLAYIAFSDKSGPLDQTDIERTVFLEDYRRWSTIRETGPDWSRHQGGRPRD